MIDNIHSPKNLKGVDVVMDRRVPGGLLHVHADTGPHEIYLNPEGGHVELSLLHELGHYLEWQSIPKSRHGARDFSEDVFFAPWLRVVYETPTVQRLLALLSEQDEST